MLGVGVEGLRTELQQVQSRLLAILEHLIRSSPFRHACKLEITKPSPFNYYAVRSEHTFILISISALEHILQTCFSGAQGSPAAIQH